MERISLNVGKQFCAECSMAVRRFIGRMDGVESIEMQNDTIEIAFDPSQVSGEDLFRISKDSIEKLGYKLLDER